MALLDIMAAFSTEAATTASLGATTSSAEINLQAYRAILYVCNVASTIKFGNTGMSAASASDFLIPANTIVKLQVSKNNQYIRIFNTTAGSGNYWIQSLNLQA